MALCGDKSLGDNPFMAFLSKARGRLFGKPHRARRETACALNALAIGKQISLVARPDVDIYGAFLHAPATGGRCA